MRMPGTRSTCRRGRKFSLGGIGGDGSVGIWHETYQVQAGGYECIYGNMPLWGLGKVGEHVPVVGRMETAKSRMGQAPDA